MGINYKIYIINKDFVGKYLKKTNDLEKTDIVINTIGILKEEKYTYEQSHIKKLKEPFQKVKNKKLIHILTSGNKKELNKGFIKI